MNKTTKDIEVHKNNLQIILDNINFDEQIKQISHNLNKQFESSLNQN